MTPTTPAITNCKAQATALKLPAMLLACSVAIQTAGELFAENGDATVAVAGELKQWHKVTLTLNGPFANETDEAPNPFLDYEMNVTFAHESGEPTYVVPGYFAADGNAAESSAQSGTAWRAHLAPDKPGRWDYRISFRQGRTEVAADEPSTEPLPPYDGRTGSFSIAISDKSGRDLRAQGRLDYVGERYLRFAGSGRYFLKVGADAPETLLGYADFDGTIAGKPKKVPLKTFAPHLKDWRDGDPSWQGDKGKGLIGDKAKLAGISLQNSHIKDTHWQVIKWVRASQQAGKPWVVAFDESGSTAHGQPPDLGYRGFDGRDRSGKYIYTEHEVRQQTLWGTLMGGGAGVEYYFGYQFAENDLVCEDWRSRDRSWDYCRIAIEFFHEQAIPVAEMQPADELVAADPKDNRRYCLAKPGEVYLVYLATSEEAELDLSGQSGLFTVRWYNPRSGGELLAGSKQRITGGGLANLGAPPQADGENQDWLAVIRR